VQKGFPLYKSGFFLGVLGGGWLGGGFFGWGVFFGVGGGFFGFFGGGGEVGPHISRRKGIYTMTKKKKKKKISWKFF